MIARTSGNEDDIEGLTTFIIPSDSPGMRISPLSLADSRNYAAVELDNLEVLVNYRLGEEGAASGALESILDLGRIAIASEMLGMTEEAF